MPVLMSRGGPVKSGPFHQEDGPERSEPFWDGSALATASLYDTFDFIAYGAFEQCRKMFVHPLANERLHGGQQVRLVFVHPFMKEWIDCIRDGAFEYRLDGVSAGRSGARSRRARLYRCFGYLVRDMREGVVQRFSGLVGEDV